MNYNNVKALKGSVFKRQLTYLKTMNTSTIYTNASIEGMLNKHPLGKEMIMTKNEFRIRMALTLCKEFKESNTKAMVQALKYGNREIAEWYEGKIYAYDQVIDMLEK